MGPCPAYTRERLEELAAGRESLTVLEILDLDIPALDKLWAVLLREEVLGTELYRAFGHACADRVVERHALHCGIPEVEQWAARWLGGEDRTEAAAWDAWAAARAAWPAARAAWDAAWDAWAAARAAWAAAWDAAGDAGAAAWAAARAAARDAIGAAAGTTEREWQVQKLKELLR
jgi:hypothetical protein